MATKMKMVMKGGKSVPAFAADGKGKMQMGGSTISNKAKVAINKIRVNINKQNVNADKVNANKDKVTTNNRKVGFKETPKQAAARKKENYSNELNYQASKTYASKSKMQMGGSTTKKMQYGGSSMSLGPVTDFKQIPKPAPTASSTTPATATAAAPAPTSVKEAREQARIAKINAKAKGYAEGTIVPGRNTGRLIDAGVEGARLVNNAMESRRNPGGMQNGGTILKKATMKPKMQNGGVVKKLLNTLMFAPSKSRKVVVRESKKNDKNIKLYNKKKPSLSPNEIKNLKGMTPPPIRNKMQMGGATKKK